MLPRPRWGLPLLLALLLAPRHGGAAAVDIAAWEFETDPHDVGATERWFSAQARPTLARNISSAATWQAQGVGKLGGYNGVGWYRAQLAVPPIPPGGSAWLWIGGAPGGVLRSANVYANAVHVGRHVGYLAPLEMELPPAALSSGGGSLTLTVAVDSRWNRTEDPLWASGALGTCFSFGGCGGMIGTAQLRVRERAWIEDSVHTSCADAGGGAWRCSVGLALLGVLKASDRVALSVCESTGDGCVSAAPAAAKSSGRMTLSVMIPAAKLWVPGTRQAQASLYLANLTLSGGDGRPIATTLTRFGVRSLSTDGPRILFNGEPLFLRGFGDDGQYGFSGAPPMDKGFYTAQLEEVRRLGFNYIRCASTKRFLHAREVLSPDSHPRPLVFGQVSHAPDARRLSRGRGRARLPDPARVRNVLRVPDAVCADGGQRRCAQHVQQLVRQHRAPTAAPPLGLWLHAVQRDLVGRARRRAVRRALPLRQAARPRAAVLVSALLIDRCCVWAALRRGPQQRPCGQVD